MVPPAINNNVIILFVNFSQGAGIMLTESLGQSSTQTDVVCEGVDPRRKRLVLG